ncbi:MAG: SDR family NAD(P)-dependent oxidoreductase [Leptolyngbyaceae cyanobacterium]
MIQSRAQHPNSHPNNYRDLLREATLQLRSLRSELDTVRQQQTEPIAIVGMACRFPGGANSPAAYWELLRQGVDAITEIPQQRWDVAAHYDPDAEAPGKMYTRSGGFIDRVDQFDPQFFGISPREAHSLDPQQRLLLEVSYTALENAGQPPFDLRGTRTGVFVGVSFDDYAQLSVRSGDLTRIDAHSSLGNTRSIVAGRLAYTFGLQGPTMQLDTTCSSSLLAVHLACQSLRNGEANLALAGGVNLMLTPEPTIGFCKLKALAPDGRCKTFDAAADGYGRGEGCGVVVLKRLSDAIDNQDPILAVVRGSAVNHDGMSNGLTAPNGKAQASVLRAAIANAHIEPEQLQYVEVHGTGTRLGDPIEVLALNQVMGQRSTPLLIGSAKTNIGHLESAAGVAGLIKVILSLQHQQIPPHLHLQTPNPYIPWHQLAVAVPTQLTPWPATPDRRLAGVSAFGMSGTNVHLVLEEAPEDEFKLQNYEFKNSHQDEAAIGAVINPRPLHVLPLSARSDGALRQLVQRYHDGLEIEATETLPDICFSAGVGRSHFNHRLALVAADLPDLRQQLARYLDDSSAAITAASSSQSHRKIAFLFTGQGSQYPHMGRALYNTEPVFRQAIDHCAEILADEGVDLLEVLYGGKRIGNRKQGTEENPSPLTSSPPHSIHATAHTQPALFAIEYALAQLWLAWGIEPDGVMGHSIGEYVAACVAGVFSLEDGLRLVTARGHLMQALPAGGGMVAVMAAAAPVSGILPEGVAIAAINGPEATVISGELTALEAVVARLTEQGIKTQSLTVSHAFHSAMMAPMLAEFRAVANTVSFASPQIDLVSNVTGRTLTAEVASADYWVSHIRQPVQFAAGMTTLAADNYDTFIEIGPKPVLAAMGQACLPEVKALWLPSLRPDADWQTLLTSLGQLYMAGATIDWAGGDRAYPRQMVKLPNYPFQHQRYWVELPKSSPPPLPCSSTLPLHPLLGTPLPLAGTTARYFQAQLHPAAPAYLKDHQVFGAVVMPAAGYLESAIAAAHACQYPAPMLRDVSLLKALSLPASESVIVQTAVTPLSAVAAAFEIFSAATPAAATWQRHVKGRIEPGSPLTTSFPLAAKQQELANPMTAERVYDTYQQRGLTYGPKFRALQAIWLGAGEALAHLQVSDELLADSPAYHLHPVLLDAGLQLAGVTLDQPTDSATYLPVEIQCFRLQPNAAHPPQWIYVKRHPQGAAAAQPVIDIALLAADGTAIAVIEGLRLQKVSPELLWGDSQPPAEPETTGLYQVAWQLQSLPTQPLDFLPSPAIIRDRLAADFTQLLAQPEFIADQTQQPQLAALSLSYIAQALEKLGWSPRLSETLRPQSMATQLAIAPQQRQLFQHLLEKVQGRQGTRNEVPGENPEPATLYPLPSLPSSSELALLTRCGENLAAVLRGEIEPLTLLFPNGNLSDLTQLYEQSPGAQVMNTLVQRAVTTAIAQAQRPLRILEIGAGTGGTTAHLLPQLQTANYVFTDVSPLFLQQAQERFEAYPGVRYELLDIERSPAEQGFQQPFDLIIAANVLHATADLRQTLAHVRALLAPGGELILLEGTQPVIWLDLIFGLTAGWWKFTDRDLRPHHPLLAANQWLDLLATSGFTAAVLQPEPWESSSADLPQAVMVAQRDDRPASAAVPHANWLILAESVETGERLADSLQQQGQSAQLATFAPADNLQNALFLDGSAPDLEAQLLQILQTASTWQGVVYVTASSGNEDALPAIAQTTCRRALHLVQALLKAQPTAAPRLYLVTPGATSLHLTAAGLARSPLWGFAKTVNLEHPELRCTCVDLQGHEVEPLVAELLADSPEQQVCLQSQQRRVARLQPYTLTEATTDSSVRLAISEPGVLTNLTFEPINRRSPAADEVEIQVAATGLNFRDVLMALGQYPGEPVLGCECVGEVVAVGDAVQDLAVGQRVMGIAVGSFGQFVTVNRAMVMPVPENLSLTAAATIPVAFLTAHYSLVECAQIKAGDCVLIHAAAGGVGQAAIQIAQTVGAEIIATASPSKWEALQSLGITHIFNSRSLDFADEITALTQGSGVDIVLNSLAGEFRDRSLQVLHPDGRFIELGLGDLSIPTDKAYFPVNLVALCQEQPNLIQSMLHTLHQQFESGILHPLPYATFPLTEAPQAFRTMQQGKHIGKIVLQVKGKEKAESRRQKAEVRTNIQQPITHHPEQNQNPSTRPPSHSSPPSLPTYLITGGLGGLGLLTADWLVAQGDCHLVLLSRRSRAETSAATQSQVQALEAKGAKVTVLQADVTKRETLAPAIASLNTPLRGVIHAAGVLSDGRLEQLAWPQFEHVLAPKVEGAWNLHQLTQEMALDFFVMFSSAASLLGSPGQANHAAANAFLDGLAHYRRSQGLPALSLNWGAWSEIGSALKYQQGKALTGLQGVNLISPEQGLEKLTQVWTQPSPQIGIVPIEWSALLRQGKFDQSPFLETLRRENSPSDAGLTGSNRSQSVEPAAFRQQLAATPRAQQRALLDGHVCAQISQLLGFAPEKLDRQAGFFDLGLDSLTAMELKNSLQASLGCSLPATVTFDYPTVERLLDYLAEQLLTAPLQAVPTHAEPEPQRVAVDGTTNVEPPLREADLAAQLDQKLADLEDLMN